MWRFIERCFRPNPRLPDLTRVIRDLEEQVLPTAEMKSAATAGQVVNGLLGGKATLGVGRLFSLRDRRPAVYPLAVLVMLLALWSWPSYTDAYAFTKETWPVFSLLIGIGVPILLWGAALLRRRPG